MADDHLQSISECPDCASQNIVHGMMRDQIICRDCGLIFEPFAPAMASSAPKVAVRAKAKKPKARKAKLVRKKRKR